MVRGAAFFIPVKMPIMTSASHPQDGSTARQPIRVQPGAANYFSHPGALDELARFFPQQRLFWIGGERATAAAMPWLPACVREARSTQAVFRGHCSETNVAALCAQAGDAEVIIGVGGGSALDTAKAVAARLSRPFVAIPTIAATCAAWTPLSVWYDDAGRALSFELFALGSHLVLVEPRILVAAPAEYLRAGIGDTLAKWYEARVLCARESAAGASLPLTARLGLETARQVRDVLLESGPVALTDAAAGQATAAFLDVVDAVIAGGGLVGGLGERYTRLAAAHSVHNGLTVLPQTASVLHGAKVAYGILVQLALEGREDELQELTAAYAPLGLPARLADLGVDVADSEALAAFIAHTLRPVESIHYLPGRVDAERLKGAILRVEG